MRICYFCCNTLDGHYSNFKSDFADGSVMGGAFALGGLAGSSTSRAVGRAQLLGVKGGAFDTIIPLVCTDIGHRLTSAIAAEGLNGTTFSMIYGGYSDIKESRVKTVMDFSYNQMIHARDGFLIGTTIGMLRFPPRLSGFAQSKDIPPSSASAPLSPESGGGLKGAGGPSVGQTNEVSILTAGKGMPPGGADGGAKLARERAAGALVAADSRAILTDSGRVGGATGKSVPGGRGADVNGKPIRPEEK